MKVAAVGVHVLDTHVVGIESIPPGSDGALVETIRMSPAGTAGGTAVVLARLGAEVTSYGAVGDDAAADTLLALLAREGVDVGGLVRIAEQQTSASVLPVRPNGDRPAWHCIGANGAFTLDHVDLDALAEADHVHLGGPEFLGGEAAGRLLAHARAGGRHHLAGPAGPRRPRPAGLDRRRPAAHRLPAAQRRAGARPHRRSPRWPRARGRWSTPGRGAWP